MVQTTSRHRLRTVLRLRAKSAHNNAAVSRYISHRAAFTIIFPTTLPLMLFHVNKHIYINFLSARPFSGSCSLSRPELAADRPRGSFPINPSTTYVYTHYTAFGVRRSYDVILLTCCARFLRRLFEFSPFIDYSVCRVFEFLILQPTFIFHRII